MDYFWAGDKVRKIFLGLLIHTNNFCFLNIALFLLYLQFIFLTDGGTDVQTDRQTDGQTKVLIEAPPELKNGTYLNVTSVVGEPLIYYFGY